MYKIIAHTPPTISFNTVIGLVIVSYIAHRVYKLFARKKSQGVVNTEES